MTQAVDAGLLGHCMRLSTNCSSRSTWPDCSQATRVGSGAGLVGGLDVGAGSARPDRSAVEAASGLLVGGPAARRASPTTLAMMSNVPRTFRAARIRRLLHAT